MQKVNRATGLGVHAQPQGNWSRRWPTLKEIAELKHKGVKVSCQKASFQALRLFHDPVARGMAKRLFKDKLTDRKDIIRKSAALWMAEDILEELLCLTLLKLVVQINNKVDSKVVSQTFDEENDKLI